MEQLSTVRRWVMFAILMVASVAINMSQLKITPISSLVSAELSVDLTSVAWLTSVFTIAAIVLSLPGSNIMSRIGPKRMLVILMLALLVGNALGFVATSYPVMLVSRIIEGISCALIIPCGLSLIALWFSGTEAGVATGLYTLGNSIGNFIIMNISLPLVNAAGSVRVLWVLVFVLALICVICVSLFVVDAHAELEQEQELYQNTLSLREATYGNKPLVTICLAMFFLSLVLMGIVTCYPTIFTSIGIDSATANTLSGYNGLFGIPVAIIAGLVIGKTGKPLQAALIGAIGTLVVAVGIIFLVPQLALVHVLLLAIFPGGLAITAFFIVTPLLATLGDYVPMATGMLNTFYFLGIFVSTPLFTALSSDGSDWSLPGIVMAVFSVICMALIVVTMWLRQKRLQELIQARSRQHHAARHGLIHVAA